MCLVTRVTSRNRLLSEGSTDGTRLCCLCCILTATLPFFRLRAQLDDCTVTLLQHSGASYCMFFMSGMVTCASSVLDASLTYSNIPTTTTTTTKDGNHQSDKLKTAKQSYDIYNVTNWLYYNTFSTHEWTWAYLLDLCCVWNKSNPLCDPLQVCATKRLIYQTLKETVSDTAQER